MRGMQILGEPFTFGPESVTDFMRSSGLRSLEVVPSDVCLRGRKDPVYAIYKFCVASADLSAETGLPSTFAKTRVDRKSRPKVRPHHQAPTAHESPRTAAPRELQGQALKNVTQ